MSPIEHVAAAAVSLLFFGLAFSLIVDTTSKQRKHLFLDDASASKLSPDTLVKAAQ